VLTAGKKAGKGLKISQNVSYVEENPPENFLETSEACAIFAEVNEEDRGIRPS